MRCPESYPLVAPTSTHENAGTVLHSSSKISSSAAQVGTDIILVTVYCSEGAPPKLLKTIEKSLLIGSIGILSFFVVEWWVEVRYALPHHHLHFNNPTATQGAAHYCV